MSKHNHHATREDKHKPGSDAVERNPALGQPGYRTREGRSGLDPLDTSAEQGRVVGTLAQRMFTGKLRTRDPLALLALALVALLGIAPAAVAIMAAAQGQPVAADFWLLAGIALILGLAALVNLVRNLANRARR